MKKSLATLTMFVAMAFASQVLPAVAVAASSSTTVVPVVPPSTGNTTPSSPGFRTGPPVCTTNAFTTTPLGQVYQWCPGVPTAGGGCSVPTMCKRCEANGSWGPDYRC